MENKLNSCRFCLSKGNHKDIMREYNWNGIREVYYDMFQECFNIYLCTNSNKSLLICDKCVSNLRQAFSFRMQVVNAEQQIFDMLHDKDTVFVNVPVGKLSQTEKDENNTEVKLEQCDDENDTDIYGSDNMDFSSTDEEVEGETQFVSRFPLECIKPLPTRNILHQTCEEFVKHLTILKGKHITAKSLEKLLEVERNGKIYITEKIAHVVNITTLLENSNLTAFKTKRRAGLPCYFCRKIFDNYDQLQQHQNLNRCKINIRKLLSKSPSESLVVYVYVKNLKCILCGCDIQSINELKTHLVRAHEKKLHLDYGDRVIPFKFSKNQYECYVCGFNFETFGSVERHMNVHYRNYVCDQCGAGYITKNRLKVHLKYSHVNGAYPCGICNKIFTTQYKHKSHVDSVHRMIKKNKCPKCPERFSDYFNRHKHMVDVHGDPPLRYRCNVCDTSFKRRYALSCHMKRRHLEVRDVQCSMCPYKCYTSTELKVHMVKHNGERTYECTVCKKSYARKKTLKEHMRIHNNDKRYVCVACGQAFVQNCSLKSHMKAHHQQFGLRS